MLNPIIDFIADATVGAISSEAVADECEKRGISGFPRWILTTLGGAALASVLKKLFDAASYDNELGLNTMKPIELFVKLENDGISDCVWVKFNNMEELLKWLESLSDEHKSRLSSFWARQASLADYIRQANNDASSIVENGEEVAQRQIKAKDDEIRRLTQDKKDLEITLANQLKDIKLKDNEIQELVRDKEDLERTLANQENKINSLKSSQPKKEKQKSQDQKNQDQMSGCIGGVVAVPIGLVAGVISNNSFIGFLVFGLVLGAILNMFEAKN
jgi:hypothetical protein